MSGVQRRQALQYVTAALCSGLPVLGAAQGETYPERPVRLIVPFPAGALTDSLGRLVAERLRSSLGQPVVVENRPGVGTLLGASQVAKSAPDGYTLLLATSSTLAISPAMHANPPATREDFTPVAMIGSVTLLLVAHPDFPATNLAQLVAQVKKNPGKYNFASPGTGTMHQLLMEMIKMRQKVFITHIPYQGSVPALTDLMAGRIDFMFIDMVAGLPQINAGKVKVLAVVGAQRSALLPQVATVAETYPDIDIQPWQSVVAPKGTPASVVAKLHGSINNALATTDMRATLLKIGVEPNPLTLAQFEELIRKDAIRFAELVKFSGSKAP